MNTTLVFRLNQFSTTVSAGFSALALAALLVMAGGSSPAAATSLRITNTGRDTEALPTFRLDWDASSNATYLVQSADSFAPGATWNTLDAVQPADKVGSYQLQVVVTDSTGLSSPPAKFYRLVLPQPQILSVEPSIVPPGVAVDLYVLGQCFPTNAVLQINGVTQAGAVVVSSSLATVPGFVPDVPGTYQVTLVVGGSVVSSFNVTCADPLANPELVLQEPPTEPPASPLIAAWLSKKGYDYYKAQGDLSAKKDFKGHVTLLKAFDDGSDDIQEGKKDFKGHVTLLKAFDDEDGDASSARGHTKTGHVTLLKAFDDENDNSSARGHTKTGHVTLMKAFDDGSDDIQEGKKGLNAVNVKLARMAGGGGGGGGGGTASRHKNSGHASESLETVLEQIPFSGEVQECDVDMVIPGLDLDFVWARTYHSRIGRFGSATNGWTFSYDVRCAQNSSGGLNVYDGTGRKDTFTLGTNGVYTCPEFFREGTLSNNTFTLTFADTGRWVFNPFDGSPTAGLVHQVITRNGSVMTLSHNATSGRLTQIVDDLGRTNTVDYDTGGRVASVTDFTGRSVTYQYYQGLKGDLGGAGDLKSVTSPPVTGTPNGNDFPDGKTTTYTYSTSFPADRENHLLLTVTDPKGQTAAVFTYEHNSASANYLRCSAAQEGTNPAACYSYSAFRGTPHVPVLPASWCIVNDPVGNVTQYYFDARNRCLIEDDYTGRATPGLPVTDTLNRPTGQLRSTDPAYYETTWSWNNDSLCTAEISPGGQQVRCVYQSDFDPSTTARKRADCRVVREIAPSAVDLDGDGVADVTDRSWHFDYDPRFGSDPMPSYGKKLYVGNLPFRESPTEPSRGMLRESPTKSSLRESPTLSRLRESPTLSHLRESPTKQSVGIRESPTEPSRGMLRESPTLSHLRESPTKSSLRESPSKASLGRTALRESPTLPSLGFCTAATDPRGDVTTFSYDATGNATSARLGGGAGRVTFNPFNVTRAYNSHGQVTAITNAPDANGRSRVDTFSYYTSGPQAGCLQQCVVDAVAGGLALTSAFEYDARGNLTRTVDPRGNDCLFTYNALDQCVRAQSPPNISARCATDYFYDANDNLVSCATQLRDASDNLVGTRVDRVSYDGLDRLTEIALAVDATHALTNRYVYDGNNQCVQVLGGDAVSGADPHQTVAYVYDERGLLFREIAAPGSGNSPTNEFDYDPNGQTARVNKVEALVIKQKTFTYDGFSRLASATDEMGNQATFNYDANDNPKVVRQFGELDDVLGSAGNIRLAESRYDYDGLDRLVVQHDLHFNPATQAAVGDGEATTRIVFAPIGQCTSVTDDLGHTTSYAYDTACRPVSVTDALGNRQSVVYDANGNPLAEISSELPAVGGKTQVFSVTNVYDTLNRCVSRTDSAGNMSSCAYDSLDRCVQTMDPRGTRTFYTYDLLDRCTIAIGDLNGDGFPDFTHDITTTFTWSSSSDNLLAVTDSHTNTTSYDYDSLGRCTAVARADGTHEQLTWSPRSNLIFEQDANGTTITNIYDLCDRIVHRDIAARTVAGVAATTTFETFTYDGCDRLTGAANDSGSSAFTYNSLDDCVSETLNGLTTASTYDALGNRLSLTYPGGRVLSYTYDALNRCSSVTDSGQQLASYAYDGPDRVSLITYGNGTRTQIAYDGFAGTANGTGDYGFGQIRRTRNSVIASGAVIDDRTFSYDPDQNKISRDTTLPFTLGGAAQAQMFQYDPACRLVNSLVTTNGSVARLTTYGLDRMGNRTNVTGAASCSGDYTLDATWPIPADFQMNQYTATPCDTRSYDDNGNLVNRSSPVTGPTTYQYDYADRLVQAQVVDFSSGAPVVTTSTYAYDPLGRRVSKSVSSGGLPAATTLFLYDGESVVEERSGTTTTATYVRHGGDETDQDCGGMCFVMRRSGLDYYYHTDDQGNVLALSGATGVVVERYDYDDYGAVTFLTSDGFPTSATLSSVGNPYCWGGLRLDAETGLHNDDGGGYFEPQTGRAVRGKVKSVKDMGTNGHAVDGNNPWSGGGGGGGGEMQKGTVKFFNDAKGFGIVVGGGSKTHTKTGHVTLMK